MIVIDTQPIKLDVFSIMMGSSSTTSLLTQVSGKGKKMTEVVSFIILKLELRNTSIIYGHKF